MGSASRLAIPPAHTSSDHTVSVLTCAARLTRGLLSRLSEWIVSYSDERVRTSIFHILSDFVVDHWSSDGSSSSHHDVLLLHDAWTTSHRLTGHKITSMIAMA